MIKNSLISNHIPVLDSFITIAAIAVCFFILFLSQKAYLKK